MGGGEFAGKIIAFVKFKCVNSSTALQIDPEHTFPDFYARGRTRFWRVVEILKLQPSEMFKFSVGGAVGVRHITKKNDISLFKKKFKNRNCLFFFKQKQNTKNFIRKENLRTYCL